MHIIIAAVLLAAVVTVAPSGADDNTCIPADHTCTSVAANDEMASPLPPAAYIALKNNLQLCRVTHGLWQLSGAHDHRITQANLPQAVQDLATLIKAGFTSIDLADHYGPAEDVVGAFRSAHPDLALVSVFMTKWVPQPGPMNDAVVLQALDVSRRRMKMPVLDLVQFHWWDYSNTNYRAMIISAQHLVARGVLKGVALTNFDTQRLRELASSTPIMSNQVSFSLIDLRPIKHGMLKFCQEQQIALIAYGVLLGGLLSERFLNQSAAPSQSQLDTASLRKYYNFVQQWGSWALFQQLLQTLDQIAHKHGVSIANVAVRWVLEQSPVVVALIGARVGKQIHPEDNARVFAFGLDGADLDAIAHVQSQARFLEGDCGDEYRS